MSILAIGNPTLDLLYSQMEIDHISKLFRNTNTKIGEEVNEDIIVQSMDKGFIFEPVLGTLKST